MFGFKRFNTFGRAISDRAGGAQGVQIERSAHRGMRAIHPLIYLPPRFLFAAVLASGFHILRLCGTAIYVRPHSNLRLHIGSLFCPINNCKQNHNQTQPNPVEFKMLPVRTYLLERHQRLSQRSVSTKSSVSQLTFFYFILGVK